MRIDIEEGKRKMNLCTGSGQHEEICFEEEWCPLCETIEEVRGLVKELEEATKQVDELKKERKNSYVCYRRNR